MVLCEFFTIIFVVFTSKLFLTIFGEGCHVVSALGYVLVDERSEKVDRTPITETRKGDCNALDLSKAPAERNFVGRRRPTGHVTNDDRAQGTTARLLLDGYRTLPSRTDVMRFWEQCCRGRRNKL